MRITRLLAAAAVFLWAGALQAVELSAVADFVLPDYMKVQHAGNTGLFSGGMGYTFSNERLHADASYGYVPSNVGGVSIHTFTGRLTAIPFKVRLNREYALYPVTASVFGCYTPGDRYVTKWRGAYPDGYYAPTSFYSGESIGMRLRSNTGGSAVRAVDGYVEVGTLSQYVDDYRRSGGELKVKDIINVSFGVVFYR